MAVDAWRSLHDAAPDSNLALSFLVSKVSEEDAQLLSEWNANGMRSVS